MFLNSNINQQDSRILYLASPNAQGLNTNNPGLIPVRGSLAYNSSNDSMYWGGNNSTGPTGAYQWNQFGPQGNTGSIGPTGHIGPSGPMGAGDNTGPTGVIGPSGPMGAGDNTGPTGIATPPIHFTPIDPNTTGLLSTFEYAVGAQPFVWTCSAFYSAGGNVTGAYAYQRIGQQATIVFDGFTEFTSTNLLTGIAIFAPPCNGPAGNLFNLVSLPTGIRPLSTRIFNTIGFSQGSNFFFNGTMILYPSGDFIMGSSWFDGTNTVPSQFSGSGVNFGISPFSITYLI